METNIILTYIIPFLIIILILIRFYNIAYQYYKYNYLKYKNLEKDNCNYKNFLNWEKSFLYYFRDDNWKIIILKLNEYWNIIDYEDWYFWDLNSKIWKNLYRVRKLKTPDKKIKLLFVVNLNSYKVFYFNSKFYDFILLKIIFFIEVKVKNYFINKIIKKYNTEEKIKEALFLWN